MTASKGSQPSVQPGRRASQNKNEKQSSIKTQNRNLFFHQKALPDKYKGIYSNP
ncbi:MAG: hypothetical protein JSR83_26055 [Proteobacteria bacterium]|nr:hypothetical protein [Pseudomonadota bacterium]